MVRSKQSDRPFISQRRPKQFSATMPNPARTFEIPTVNVSDLLIGAGIFELFLLTIARLNYFKPGVHPGVI